MHTCIICSARSPLVTLLSLIKLLAAEWFSPDLKLLVSMILICYQFLMIFVAVQITDPIISYFGHYGLFFFFCIICSSKTGFLLAFVPETHGKTYEDIAKVK